MDVAVDTMVLIYSLAFPADSKFLASGSVVEVVRAYRLQLSFMLSSNGVLRGCDLLELRLDVMLGCRDLGCEMPESASWTRPWTRWSCFIIWRSLQI